MNISKVPQLKSLCCKSNVQTTFDQFHVVEVYENGTYKEVNSFIDPDNCPDYYWCKECGAEVPLVWNQEEEKYLLTMGDEMTFNNLTCVYIK